MTKTSGVLTLLIALFAMPYAFGQDGNNATKESIVVPAENVKDFSVTGPNAIFRLSVDTISGAEIEKPVVTGSAKHIRTEEITTVEEGGQIRIGGVTQHFVFRGTGLGKVKIVVKYKTPTSPDPVVETYNVTIK